MFNENKTKFAKLYLLFAAVVLAIIVLAGAISSAAIYESFAMFIAQLFNLPTSLTAILLIVSSLLALAILNEKDTAGGNKAFLMLVSISVAILILKAIYTFFYAIFSSVKFDSVDVSGIVLNCLQLIATIVFVVLAKFFPIIIDAFKEYIGIPKCSCFCAKKSEPKTPETADDTKCDTESEIAPNQSVEEKEIEVDKKI